MEVASRASSCSLYEEAALVMPLSQSFTRRTMSGNAAEKTLKTIGQDIYRKHSVRNQMLDDVLYEEFDTIGMRTLARYMKGLPHVPARFVC